MQTTTIWTPAGFEARESMATRRAVREYDENLDFGKNEKTGDWCVYLKRGTTVLSVHGDLPILGFQHLPGPDEVVKRIYETDAQRRGKAILEELNKHNETQHDEGRRAVADAEGQVAETFEWGLRKQGATSHKRVYIP